MVHFGESPDGDSHRFRCPQCRSELAQPMGEIAAMVDAWREDVARLDRFRLPPMDPSELASVSRSACNYLRARRALADSDRIFRSKTKNKCPKSDSPSP